LNRADESGVAALLSDYRHFAGAKLWLALGLMILGALAEGFGLLMIVPIATIALNGGDAAVTRILPWLTSWPRDQRFLVALALFVAAMAARSILLYARDLRLVRLQADYKADLKLRAAATLADRGWPFASAIGQAGMQSLLLNDVPRVGKASASLQSILVSGVMLAVQLAVALLLSPALASIAIGLIAAAFLVSSGLTARGATGGHAIGESMDSSASAGFRFHVALKVALAQGTVRPFLQEYRSSLSRVTVVVAKFSRDYSIARYAAAFGAALAAALLLLVGVRLLTLPFPVLIASVVLFSRMSAPAQLLQASLMRLAADATAFTAIERRLGKLDVLTGAAVDQASPLDWDALEVDGVEFEHKPGIGLRRADLHVRRGEWIGVSGASGAGKTTLIDLVAGLMPPQRGSIHIDGHALDGELLRRWRTGIAYVGQEGSVFNDSVRGNLLAEGASATDEELWQALETVGLSGRVRVLGLDEDVGDRGSQLSGGERQRLVLARALLRRPSLLILDEATAALDPDAEAELLKRLKALEPRPAALVVAHRDSTLRHCDSVVAIQHGEMTAPQPLTAAE
jgi:ATP-binding cassette subfamily C protein